MEIKKTGLLGVGLNNQYFLGAGHMVSAPNFIKCSTWNNLDCVFINHVLIYLKYTKYNGGKQ